ncbi:MAG: type II toxin-antitoxin system VapC family toxin [Rhodospirillales bacterium]|nr:type II toxin-antitoxin system VapC family toxin [Rhodospirillales bacterium]
MRYLLDTHALLWWLGDDTRIGPGARAAIADPGNQILVSIASLWEIVVKQRIGKLEADIGAVLRAVERDGFTMLEIAPAALRRLASLPAHHRDPFDHLLIAQAIAARARFLTADRRAALYPVDCVSCAD